MNRLLCWLLLCCTSIVVAQNQSAMLEGVVTNTVNEFVIGATVVLKNSSYQRQTITDHNGQYTFVNVPLGKYQLQVNDLTSKIITPEFTIATPTFRKDITLNAEESHLIKTVEIDIENQKAKITNKGYAVQVVETQQAGLRNLQTNELLDRTVGVRIRQNGGLGSEVNYNINGMSGNAVRIFLDGIPLSSYGSSFDLNSIPPSMIERIEVYKGVVPSHLSDDALGGAINVVLKKGFKNSLNISSSYGSFNTSQLNFSGMYRLDSGLTFKASGFYNKSDNDYEVWGRNVYNILPNGRQEYVRVKRFNDAFDSKGGVVEVGFSDVKWADQFFIGFTGSDAYKEVQHGTFMTTPYKGRFVESDAQLFSLTYNKKDIFTKGLDLNFHGILGERNRMVNDTVKWNYNWSGERSLDLNGNPILRPQGAQQGAPTLAHILRKTASLRTGLSYELNTQHKFLLNYMYQRVDREDDDQIRTVLERKFFGTRDLDKAITSVAYEFNGFSNRLRTTIFGKNYHQKIQRMNPVAVAGNVVEQTYSNTKDENGYGFAAWYKISKKLAVNASAEKAIRLPNENEIFGDAGDNITENAGINPESSKNLNLGLRLTNIKLSDHMFDLSFTSFLRDIKDRIGVQVQTQLNSNLQTVPYVNQGNAKSKGFDAELNYTYKDQISMMVNVSKFRLTYKNMLGEKDIPNEPNFMINATAQYSLKNVFAEKSRLNLYYSMLFVDKFNYLLKPYGNNAGADFFNVPEQFIQDVGVSYVFPKKDFILSFDVKNLFDKQAFDNLAVQKPGRAFYVKLNYVLNTF